MVAAQTVGCSGSRLPAGISAKNRRRPIGVADTGKQVMDYAIVLPELYVGSCPKGRVHVELLRNDGVTAVECLQTEEDFWYLGIDWPTVLQWYREFGIEVVHCPIIDGDPEDLAAKLPAAVNSLAELIRHGHRVYLHCTAGVGRAPSVAVAYLHWVRGWPLERALEHMKTVRDCDPNRWAIEEATPAFLEQHEGRDAI